MFENAFFCGYADIVLNACAVNNNCLTDICEAMEAIVNYRLREEYYIQEKSGFLNENTISEDVFQAETGNILKHAAMIMERENRDYITVQELSANMEIFQKTSVLLVRDGEKVKFLHDLFFEYFLLFGIGELPYVTKYEIFNGQHTRVNATRAGQYYIRMLETGRLDVEASHLINCLDAGGISIARLFTLEKLTVKPDTSLSIRDILNLLPRVKELSFPPYSLCGDSILDYMKTGYLDLSGQKLKNLDRIGAFGAFSSLDISENEIEDLSALSYWSTLDDLQLSPSNHKHLNQLAHIQIGKLTTSVRTSQELHHLISLQNISERRLAVKPEQPEHALKLYRDIRDYLEKHKQIIIVNIMPLPQLERVCQYLQENYAADEMGYLSAAIAFLENVLRAQDNEFLEQSREYAQGFKGYLAEKYYKRGELYLKIVKYEAGLCDASRAVELAPAENAYYYNLNGNFLNCLGKYKQALESLLTASAILENNAYSDPGNIAAIYNNIAEVYDNQGDYPKALEWYQKALDICEKVLGKEHPSTATTYNNIALVNKSQGDYPKALEWQQKALDIR